MEITEGLSEIFGMFAADGNLQENHISMWGNIHEDKEYYDRVVCPLFSKVFGINVNAHEKESNSVYGFYICRKEIIKIFKDFGFTRRKTYSVKIPHEILFSKDKNIISAFIRGFADCDGCLNFMKRYEKGYSSFKRKYHTYPRIFIGVVSKQIIFDLSFLLDFLNIGHSVHFSSKKKVNEADVYRIAVRGPERINKWMDSIGFNNYSKFTKYLVWKKHGFCPTPSSLKQRELILQNELIPESLYEM